jgi:hypothetical protein
MANEDWKQSVRDEIKEVNETIEELRLQNIVFEADGAQCGQQARLLNKLEIKSLMHQRNIAQMMLQLH